MGVKEMMRRERMRNMWGVCHVSSRESYRRLVRYTLPHPSTLCFFYSYTQRKIYKIRNVSVWTSCLRLWAISSRNSCIEYRCGLYRIFEGGDRGIQIKLASLQNNVLAFYLHGLHTTIASRHERRIQSQRDERRLTILRVWALLELEITCIICINS